MRFVVAGDSHGDMVDPVAEAAFFRWLKENNPQLRIHSGDVFDMRPLRGKASDKEKAESIKDDFSAGMSFMDRMFAGGEMNYLLRGNHDERLWDLSRDGSGVLKDTADELIERIHFLLKKHNVKMLPYDARLGVLRIGHLQVIHGFKCGIGAGAAHAKTYRNTIFGHTHTQEIVPVENLDGPSVAMGTGCLCHIDMHYNSRQMNKLRHQQGWVMGTLFIDGTYQAFQVKRIGDKFYAPQNITGY